MGAVDQLFVAQAADNQRLASEREQAKTREAASAALTRAGAAASDFDLTADPGRHPAVFREWSKTFNAWANAAANAGRLDEFRSIAERLVANADRFMARAERHEPPQLTSKGLRSYAVAGHIMLLAPDRRKRGKVAKSLATALEHEQLNCVRQAIFEAACILSRAPGDSFSVWPEKLIEQHDAAAPAAHSPKIVAKQATEPIDAKTWLGPKSPKEWRKIFNRMKERTFLRYRNG